MGRELTGGGAGSSSNSAAWKDKSYRSATALLGFRALRLRAWDSS